MNPDGSTRDTKKQRVHDEIRRSYHTARTNLHSTQILIDTLSTLPSHITDLSSELHTAIDITVAQLSGKILDSDRDILATDISLLLSNIPTISDALSTYLSVTAQYLCTIAHPTNAPSPGELEKTAKNLQDLATYTLPAELQTARIGLVNTLSTTLSTHLALLKTGIRILEQTQQGTLARQTRTSAELLHSRSTLLGLQAKLHLLAHPPPDEFVAALKQFKKTQDSGGKALRDREQLAKRELELYRRAGEKGMKDLAKRKAWVVGEMERIEGEIGRLER